MPLFRAALVIVISLTALSCAPSLDKDGYRRIRPYDDPLALPYRFDVLKKKTLPIGSVAPASDRYYPLEIFGDGKIGLYVVGSSWLPKDTISCVIFYSGVDQTGALSQINLKTTAIMSHYPFDFDHDTVQEVAVTYTRDDTLWLEILDVQEKGIYRRPLVAGVDRNHSGAWDGGGLLCGVVDLTDDGHEDLLVFCGADYDLYPRKMMCVDWYQDRISWEFEVAGAMSRESTFILPSADSVDISIVLGVSSKGNAAITADMDDRHSYLICLSRTGDLLWRRVTGGVFSGGHAGIVDYRADGSLEILKTFETVLTDDSADVPVPAAGVLVLDRMGRTLDSLVLPPGQKCHRIRVFDLDGDGVAEVFLMTADRGMLVFNHLLEPLGKYRFSMIANAEDCQDYLGQGEPQLLVGMESGMTMLLSSEFEILAQFDDGPVYARSSAYANPTGVGTFNTVLADDRGSVNYWITFAKNPWNSIFFRNPLLAFLAAFLPMGVLVLVVGYYTFKIRRKNKIISQRGEKLSAAMQELRDTQEKLVAAEKYKQAKDIAGGFAHEIRNALFPARGTLVRMTGLAAGRQMGPDEIAGYAEIIDTSITRAVELTTLISRYTKLDAECRPDGVLLADLINEVVRSKQVILADAGIEVHLSGPSEAMVKSNRGQLYMVVDNLLLNSIDALTNRIKPAIFITWKKDNRLVRLSFNDNGCGIKHEEMSRVFDTFYSTKPDKGSGLGLAIAKKIVEMYGGTITVSSAVGAGTVFEIVFESDRPGNY